MATAETTPVALDGPLLHIGDRIKRRRRDLGLEQEDLARILHCDRKTISSYETGRSQPRADTCVVLADALDVTLDWLLRSRCFSDVDGSFAGRVGSSSPGATGSSRGVVVELRGDRRAAGLRRRGPNSHPRTPVSA